MEQQKLEAKSDLVVQNLLQQIAKLARENATNYALAVELQTKNTELEKELEQYKKEK